MKAVLSMMIVVHIPIGDEVMQENMDGKCMTVVVHVLPPECLHCLHSLAQVALHIHIKKLVITLELYQTKMSFIDDVL